MTTVLQEIVAFPASTQGKQSDYYGEILERYMNYTCGASG
jgi:hypothetical protein